MWTMATVLLTIAVRGEITFGDAREMDGGFNPRLADLNGDGNLDVICPSIFGGTSIPDHRVVWFENDGELPPSFTRHTILEELGTTDIDTAHPTDLDGDGDIDIISVRKKELEWHESDGGQILSFQSRKIVEGVAGDVTAVDLNRDGDIDIVCSRYEDLGSDEANLTWFENNGGQPPGFNSNVVSNLTSYVDFSDVDGDGDIDLLSSSGNEGSVWRENDGSATLGFTRHLVSDDFGPIEAKTINDNAYPDIIAAQFLSIRGNGTEVSFSSEKFSPSNSELAYSTAGDLDLDEDVDIINCDAGVLYCYESNGSLMPTFEEHIIDLSTQGQLRTPTLGDLDIVIFRSSVARAGSGILLWYENLALPKPVSILNPNGTETFANGQSIQVAWRTGIETAGTAVGLGLWRDRDEKAAQLADAWNPEGHGVETIVLPALPTRRDYRIRAVSLWNPEFFDFSDAPFSILQGGRAGVPRVGWRLYP